MDEQTIGVITKVSRQWYIKVNTKPARGMGTDGAKYPHVISIKYSVNGREYIKRKWLDAYQPVPRVGDSVRIVYLKDKPSKARVL